MSCHKQGMHPESFVMLSFIKGILISKVEQSPHGAYFLVDVHGIGFEILTHARAITETPQETGTVIQLYTAMIVRETAMSLVGFLTREERDLFNILQSASGVGVKVALALLSCLSVGDIVQCVIANHHQALTAAKGVGTKLAQKMTIELKDKMTSWRSLDGTTAESPFPPNAVMLPEKKVAYQEAESVLLSLGYEPREVQQSFKASFQHFGEEDNPSSEEILKIALRFLAVTV
jgi:holliday junction DNA helicase RuvA